MKRCGWVPDDELYRDYHDKEWGVPVYDDKRLFEMLTLEGAQAGLSWSTILKKRDGYRTAFSGFDPVKVARYSRKKVRELLSNPGIVRNRLKIESTVNNAKAVIKVQQEFGSFSSYIWGLIGGKRIHNEFRHYMDIPPETPESKHMSRELKKRGFRFVGPTICYAFMQAVGMVNDHETGCFRYRQLKSK
jgi:DNA-3-methyladenine glycosylase I